MYRQVFLLTLGTGIGGGIVINGQCWRSPTGLAPELGHIITHSDGLPCPCGQCGCFEQYASATALIRMAGGESPADLIARARSGNAAAQVVFAQYVHELCTGIVSLNSIFAPEVVALGGGISEAGDFLLDACHTTCPASHRPPTTRPTTTDRPTDDVRYGTVRYGTVRYGNGNGTVTVKVTVNGTVTLRNVT